MDVFSPEMRSRIMRKVRSKDTTPERFVRSLVHRLGHRFRLHRSDLPGKPDLVFIGKRKIVFVHGCFWHGHKCKAGEKRPKTSVGYWEKKLKRNMERDAANINALKNLGWKVLVVWECETKDEERLSKKLDQFLADR